MQMDSKWIKIHTHYQIKKNREEEPEPFLPKTEEIERKLDLIGLGTQSTSIKEKNEELYY